MKSFIDKFFHDPINYHYARAIFNLGFRYGPIENLLDPRDDDSVLDIACGIGNYSVITGGAKYLGIDLNDEYIDSASKNFGNERREFKIQDVLTISEKYPKGSFNKALMIGLLHHLTDDEAMTLLDAVSGIVTDYVVIMDNFYSKWHLPNNLICSMDRGDYVRTVEYERFLISRSFDVNETVTYYSRNALAHFVAYKASPSQAGPSGEKPSKS